MDHGATAIAGPIKLGDGKGGRSPPRVSSDCRLSPSYEASRAGATIWAIDAKELVLKPKYLSRHAA